MKNLILVCFFLVSTVVQAAQFIVHDPCSKDLIVDQYINILLPTNVGKLTIYALDSNEVEYIGNEVGLNSMLGTPTGLDAIEVLSDTHMRSYGWCFSVNGIEPNVLMNEFQIDPKSEDKIEWYFGYAEYLDGDWITYCTPTHEDPKPFICKD